LNFGRLVGIRIGPGYMRQVKKRFSRSQGCTHIMELLYPVGTTAFQTVFRIANFSVGRKATAKRRRCAAGRP